MEPSKRDIDRFMSKVDKTDTCWLWTAGLFSNGYGQFKLHGYPIGAHVVSYYLFVEPVWSNYDLMIDHTCRVKRCVNPAHLELVTNRVNQLRGVSNNGTKTHCPQGHEYTVENTYKSRNARKCKKCVLKRMKLHYAVFGKD